MSFPRQSILFISGLDKSVNETMLYQLFNDYPISYIKIAKDHQTRDSFGYAFVGFRSHSKAEEAISKLNYSKLGKKTLRISWFNRDSNNLRNHPEYNIYVKKIPKDVTHQEFHDYFSKFGNIISAKLAEDEEGEMMGYGFVLYDSAEGAENAIKSANGVEWKGKKLYVGQFVKNRPKKAPRFNNIYVKNIPKEWSKADVEKYFSRYGPIGSTLIVEPDPKNLAELPEEKKKQIVSHKFAFVCFKDFEPANKAVNQVPYYKVHDKAYNAEVDKLVEVLRKNSVEEEHLHKGAAYLLDNLTQEELNKLTTDEALLKEHIENFRKVLQENDGVYIVKDKTDRMDCCQALKKSERAKKKKQLYERIKRKIKEKYKFCNLYVKNLPDSFDDETLRSLFSKFGEIRSAKVAKRELYSSYLGIKRSVKVFGFVCFYEPAQAREAKQKLDKTALNTNGPRLYVDYHQTKQERSEYLKLEMIKNSSKVQKGMRQDFPPFMGGMNMRQYPNYQMFKSQILRKLPPQTGYNPNMMPRNFPGPQGGQFPQPQMIQPIEMDKNQRRDFYGERLYSKISMDPKFTNYGAHFSKIVGIFLDLDDGVIERLIIDDNYFNEQVQVTIRLLEEKVGKN